MSEPQIPGATACTTWRVRVCLQNLQYQSPHIRPDIMPHQLNRVSAQEPSHPHRLRTITQELRPRPTPRNYHNRSAHRPAPHSEPNNNNGAIKKPAAAKQTHSKISSPGGTNMHNTKSSMQEYYTSIWRSAPNQWCGLMVWVRLCFLRGRCTGSGVWGVTLGLEAGGPVVVSCPRVPTEPPYGWPRISTGLTPIGCRVALFAIGYSV